ncbi:CidA/LrgA family protein [Pseudomonas asuensis]|uniref:CidA/LrgA family protein n=1 Tax=Pseudomonas asuensis TaxID=1825787 RepID=A0ABQ2GMT4_9PSED|nr:CidA/LrgA family protein [Pseudomonas asuensis]GGM04271.1 CidA/LrgA family protein [Pseudomonas asuensis]
MVPRYIRTLLELAVLVGLWWLGGWLGQYFGLPIPAGVLGLAILLLFLALRLIKPEWLENGARVLVGEMLLFFIPALMSLLDYGPLVREEGIRILMAVCFSTLLVMISTALTVEWMFRRRSRQDA